MLAEMDEDDWREWPQFAELEPFGAVQDGLYFGLLASLQYNANRGKDAKSLMPADFFPHVKAVSEQQAEPSPEKSAQRLRGMMMVDAWKRGALLKRSKDDAAPASEPAP